jgi:hypothetical protein
MSLLVAHDMRPRKAMVVMLVWDIDLSQNILNYVNYTISVIMRSVMLGMNYDEHSGQ